MIDKIFSVQDMLFLLGAAYLLSKLWQKNWKDNHRRR